MQNRYLFFVCISLLIAQFAISQQYQVPVKIQWDPLRDENANDQSAAFLSFRNAGHLTAHDNLPVWFHREAITDAYSSYTVRLSKQEYAALTPAETAWLQYQNPELSSEVAVDVTTAFYQKRPMLSVSLLPLRKNELLGVYEKLISCELIIEGHEPRAATAAGAREYADHSVLAEGKWVKISVKKTGIYQLNRSDLSDMGFDVNGLDPRNIRIYGNGGGMLPESNAAFRHDDLVENAIYVEGQSDGRFDDSDYLLFYGQSPIAWEYDAYKKTFEHQRHDYSDYTYYFITVAAEPGQRIGKVTGSNDPATHQVNTFVDYKLHEKEENNLIKSGSRWFGEEFNVTTKENFAFAFSNMVPGSVVHLKTELAARAFKNSQFLLNMEGAEATVNISAVPNNYNQIYANTKLHRMATAPVGDQIDVALEFRKPTSSAIGWLDYIEINVTRELKFTTGQMAFRDGASFGYSNVAEFTLSNANGNIRVWDVTNPLLPARLDVPAVNQQMRWKAHTNVIPEYIAFDGSSFLKPVSVKSIENQDLHGVGDVDMVILTHPDFIQEARRLESLHRDQDRLDVLLTTQEEVFNEFSSGAPDIIAIRSLMKMLYDRAKAGDEPKYLLLFGDGSYDTKNRIPDNTNYILAYQSQESLRPNNTFTTDDVLGFLDDTEGESFSKDMVDIGIGRIPVNSLQKATEMVDKIMHYVEASSAVFGDWRNDICFIGDDEDSNSHMEQADELAGLIQSMQPDINIEKIYLDAYPQVSYSGGQRYPEAREAINVRMKQGALVINYTGHGGEEGLAHERVVTVSDIQSWDNYDHLPVFVTATCEFSRFDDPGRTSAGEQVYLNANGGAIAMFTTTRPTFGSPNFELNEYLYKYMFKKENGQYPRLGDVLRMAKTSTADLNSKKFVLLGDPALRLAYPEYNVVTTAINGLPVGQDTLKAVSEITIQGEVQNLDGQCMETFNGKVYPRVFDKEMMYSTLGNDVSYTLDFMLQKNVLYKGKTEVKDGRFSFTFIVPKDIAYNFGSGRISYYAENGQVDANGYDEDFIVGGYDTSQEQDLNGPDIALYMNDEYFRSGGVTDENPQMYAIVKDVSGINTVGNGIGHDITVMLDNDPDKLRVINDFYEADLGEFQSGTIRYPFFNLSEGTHTLTLKLWDVFNNSSEVKTEFVVAASEAFAIEKVMNYPNPFTDHTYFSFEHNQIGQSLDVRIEVYTLAGQLVKTIQQPVYTNGYRSGEIRWNGQSEQGGRLDRGIYLYRLQVKNESGDLLEKSEKLVILRP